MPNDFSRIDEPQENLTLSAEARSQMSDAFAQAHIDHVKSGLLDEEKKRNFYLVLQRAYQLKKVS
ncbi:MAG: hypothetical protein KGP29_01110 [Proteobacteria bacterium]|nr:hypothetical protein [Pseudomonadota bacterium]